MKYIANRDIILLRGELIMEFLQLKYFQHAAKTENFSHTAEKFRVPPSSISISIKKLETELGVKLFDRNSNKLTLNEKGRLFLKCTENIFEELDNTVASLQSLNNQPDGKIHLLVNTNRQTITKIISDFRAKYPNVSFFLDLDESKDYKNYDIVITDSIIDSGNFDKYDFIKEEIVLACHSQNPISSRKQINMSSLKNEKFISLSPNHSLRSITDKLCKQAGFNPNIVIECDDPFYIREYLKMEMGVSIVPLFSWKNQLDSSISLIRINNGVFRHSKIYVNKNATECARFFAQHIKV